MFKLISKTLRDAHKDRIASLASSISFYSLFALAPIIIIFIAVAGALFGEQAAKGELVNQIQYLIGPEMASALQVIVENAALSSSNYLFAFLSLAILLFAASRVVTNLKHALNRIWRIQPKKEKKLHKVVKFKFLSMLAILGIGLFLVILLITSAILSTIWIYLGSFIPVNSAVFQILNLVISFGLVAFILALIYKILPDVDLEWRDVWMGAILTTILFMLGNWLIGIYMRNVSIGSVYGAAGSIIIILIWLYYVSQIFLLGAEFTKVYSLEKGSKQGFFKKFLD